MAIATLRWQTGAHRSDLRKGDRLPKCAARPSVKLLNVPKEWEGERNISGADLAQLQSCRRLFPPLVEQPSSAARLEGNCRPRQRRLEIEIAPNHLLTGLIGESPAPRRSA